jgi:uncharacterized protein YdgA (DUF945 family)
VKKGSWISVAIVVVLAGSYPGLAWYSGKTVESRMNDYRARVLAQAPYLTVAEQKYERGIYRSREEITYEFGRSLFGALATASAAAGAASGGAAPDLTRGLRFTVRSEIEHGPFPGFGAPGLARIETEFAMSESTQRELAKAFGNRKPIEIVTRLKYDGDGVTELSSPAFDNFSLGKTQGTLSWKGFKATIAFGRDLLWIKAHGAAPGMEVKAPDAESVKLEEVAFASNSELAFDDLYIGDVSMSVKSMSVVPRAGDTSGPKRMSMDGVEYAGKLDRKDDFLDLNGRFKIAGLDVEAVELSDLHYEITLKHMHGPTIAAFMRLMRKSLSDGSLAHGAGAESALAQDARRLGIELLKHEPQLVIDKISFAMPEGDAKMSGIVRIIDFDPADLEGPAGPAGLVPKLDARVDVSIAEGLLEKISASSERGNLAMFEQQVAALEAQGYVTRMDGRLVTHIEFREGALTFNGKVFVPPTPPAATGKPSRDTTHT